MRTVFSKEELKQELVGLKDKKETVYNKRVSLLKKYSNRIQKSDIEKDAEIHDLNRKIESVQDKIKKLF